MINTTSTNIVHWM